MAKDLEIYKCNTCGNIIEVIHGSFGRLVCCGEEMQLEEAHTHDEGSEKHVPVVEYGEKNGQKIIKIKVGEIEHPMTNEHFIRFIEAISNDEVYVKRKMLSPNEKPILEFKCNCDTMLVREYCNIHGLWRKQV